MKKSILSLLLLLAVSLSVSAQVITLKVDNNTTQYFTATLLDNTWLGATPPMYMDLPNNMTSVRYGPPTNGGGALTSVANWRGIQLRAYPSGIYYQAAYFTAVPFASPLTAFGPSIPVNIFCDIISPTDIYIRINP